MKIDYEDKSLEAKANKLAMFTNKRGSVKYYWVWSDLNGVNGVQEIKRLAFEGGYLFSHSTDLWYGGLEHEFARLFEAFLTAPQAKKLYSRMTEYGGAVVK